MLVFRSMSIHRLIEEVWLKAMAYFALVCLIINLHDRKTRLDELNLLVA